VSISGSYAIVGAYETNSGAGAVYVYSEGDSGWSSTPTVTIPGQSGTIGGFGFSVGISDTDIGPEAIVGLEAATGAPVFTGAVLTGLRGLRGT
jgi:hypothetical protein